MDRGRAPTRWATSWSATRWSGRTRRSRRARSVRPRSSPTASTFGVGGGQVHDRQANAGSTSRPAGGRARLRPQDRRLDPRPARGDRLRRRLAQAARLRRRLAHPFLEHDDANRASWARTCSARRCRSSAPSPLVGTGMEQSRQGLRAAVVCRRAGIVDSVDSRRVIVRVRPGRPRQGQGDRGRHLQPDQVQVLEPEHEHQPEADRQGRAARGKGQNPGRRPCTDMASSPSAATCSWPSCPGAATTSRTPSWSARSSSRRTCTPRSTSRSSRSRPGHQARTGGRDPRHPERLRGPPRQPSTRAASSASGRA